MSKEGMIMNDELGNKRKEAVVACFEFEYF
jgi:hypothetical protein